MNFKVELNAKRLVELDELCEELEKTTIYAKDDNGYTIGHTPEITDYFVEEFKKELQNMSVYQLMKTVDYFTQKQFFVTNEQLHNVLFNDENLSSKLAVLYKLEESFLDEDKRGRLVICEN